MKITTDFRSILYDLRGTNIYLECKVRTMKFQRYGPLAVGVIKHVDAPDELVLTVDTIKFPMTEVECIEFKDAVWTITVKGAE